MPDQWKGKITTVAGEPVALIEISITRTILVDADVYERFERLLKGTDGDYKNDPAGLGGVADFYQFVKTVPEDSRHFVVVPWTNAENERIGLLPFGQIVEYLEKRVNFRVEGTAEEGFTGYLNFGSQDHKIDLSTNSIPAFQAKLETTKLEAQAAVNAGTLTPEEQGQIEQICNEAGRKSEACEAMYRAFAERQKQRDAEQRRQQEKQDKGRVERDNQHSERGDFDKDWAGGLC